MQAARDRKTGVAIAALLAAWPEDLLRLQQRDELGREIHSRAEALEALQLSCAAHAGAKGATCDLVRNIISSYRSTRRERRYPPETDFPIREVGLKIFIGDREREARGRQRKRPLVKGGVRKHVLGAMRSGIKFGLRVASDVDFSSLKQRTRRRLPATAPDTPCRVIASLESDARGDGPRVLSEGEKFLARSFVWAEAADARLGDFESAWGARVSDTPDGPVVCGWMDTKDGSEGCWWGFPAMGITGPLSWSAEHAEAVRRAGCMFPKVTASGAVSPASDSSAASLSAVRKAKAAAAVRGGMPAGIAATLVKGHGGRHVSVCFARKLVWSAPARAEFGMWAEGDEDLRWDGTKMVLVPRTRGLTCSQRYSMPAAQETQLRLRRSIVSAIAGLYAGMEWESVPWDNSLSDARVEASPWYKYH